MSWFDWRGKYLLNIVHLRLYDKNSGHRRGGHDMRCRTQAMYDYTVYAVRVQCTCNMMWEVMRVFGDVQVFRLFQVSFWIFICFVAIASHRTHNAYGIGLIRQWNSKYISKISHSRIEIQYIVHITVAVAAVEVIEANFGKSRCESLPAFSIYISTKRLNIIIHASTGIQNWD